ncbi:hypothetical protein [Methanobrevibacter sp.]
MAESLYDNRNLIIRFYIAFVIVFIKVWLISADLVGITLHSMPCLASYNFTESLQVCPAELFVQNGILGI